MNPPIAPRRPHVHTEHGHERHDPWFWLRDRDDPEVIAYLEAENRYTEAALAHLEGLRKTLFEEMRSRIQEDDISAPVPWGGYWYYRRTVQGLSYPIYCRRRGSMDAPEQVLLDVNELARDHEYTSLGAFEISPDHRRLAYAVDHSGREIYDVRIKDLETGEHLPDALIGIWPDLVWAPDGRTLFYTTLDATLRPWRLHRHTLGAAQSADPIVFEEPDERFRVSAYRTRSDAYIVLAVRSALTTECHVLPADRPDGAFRCLQPRHTGMRYTVEHQGDRFLVLTNDSDDAEGRHNDDAIGFKLVEAPLDTRGRADWREIVPHRPGVTLERVDAFAGHVVLTERAHGLERLRVLVPEGEGFGSPWRDDDHLVALPDPAYELGLEQNPTYDTSELRFAYSSLGRPRTVYAYDVRTRARTIVKQDSVLGDFDPDRYVVERLHATAPDGTQVPISLVRRRDAATGPGPLLLYGYGSYGISIDPGFSSVRLSLIDRGVAFAIAHVRGGGDLGKPWHEAAKFQGKMHTFQDFIACAEHLIATGRTSPDRLAIMGGSAGGMLMGAVINMRPELFRCCVAQVPFVDVVTTMLDESLPLTANEWEEWGDPRDPAMFRAMLQYSPYDNVRDQRYPDLLVTSGLNDPRVQYWEPTKWVAALRAKVSEAHRSLVLLRTNMGAGHQGRSGRYGYLEERAFDYAFVLDRLGLAEAAG